MCSVVQHEARAWTVAMPSIEQAHPTRSALVLPLVDGAAQP
jgi:hypothetical protein